MFIQLSTMDVYVWREAFDFLSPTGDRKKVAQISGFGDRRFSDVCQKWLHEWVKNICIEKLKIKAEDNKTASLRAYKWDSQKHSYNKAVVPFAESELPANIQDFKTIHIKLSHADPTVLQFLRRMQPLYRFFDLNFCFHNGQMEEAVLVQLLPILIGGGVDTIFMNMTDQPLFTIRRHFPFRFFDIRDIWLQLGDEDNTAGLVGLLLEWLGTRREDGEPRMLTLDSKADTIMELFNSIQTQFRDATSPVSFLARLWVEGAGGMPLTHNQITQNDRTNEQLVFHESNIGRCPSAENGQKWVQKLDDWIYEEYFYLDRSITISTPKLRSIDENMKEDEREGMTKKKST